MRRAIPVAALILMVGCASSPPTQFYTLEPIGPRERTLRIPPGPILIAPVHLPALLERQEIVSGRGPNEIILSDRHRWGAPLDEMTRRVLTQDLLQRLPSNEIVLPEQPAPANTRTVVVSVLRFQSDSAGRAVLEGSWSLVAPGSDTPTFSRPIALSEPATPSGYAGEVQAMSRDLGRLADDIVNALAK